MASRGVYWVAVGQRAKDSRIGSLNALRRHTRTGLGREDLALSYDEWIAIHEPGSSPYDDPRQLSRWLKIKALDYTRSDQILYLDADAFPITNTDAGFHILDDGYDLVICPSLCQSSDWLTHVGDEERATMEHLRPMASLQGGMWWIKRNEWTKKFFAVWLEEWQKYEGQDQGALLRAWAKVPLRTWLLSQERFVNHRYGMARDGPR